ncbi:MAG: futalosine hydrolase [Pseudomonadota bacterium]
MNPDLLILSATSVEAASFLTQCPAVSTRSIRAGQAIIAGNIGSVAFDLLITGPGVFNAVHALTAYLAETQYNAKPDLIVQIGIAGVFNQTSLTIGDIAIATGEYYIHTGVESDSVQNDPLPFDLIETDPKSRIGFYSFDPHRVDPLHAILSREGKEKGIAVGKAPFVTVSTITASLDTANQLYTAFSPVMEAMEGAASAHVARLYDIPMVEVRAASNIVGERDRTRWDIDLAVKHMAWACVSMFKENNPV